MINLLPDDQKKSLRAARMNVVLLRYNFITLAASGILLAALGLFFVFLSSTKLAAENSHSESQTKVTAHGATRKAADEYRANLATAGQILKNQVNYTPIIFNIAKLLPKGVVLDNIALSSKDFGSQTTISASAKDYAAVTQLKKDFEGSDMFSNVYFQSITAKASDGNAGYPLSVSISVKINKVEA